MIETFRAKNGVSDETWIAEWLKLRTVDVTSTEVAALYNLSPYTTHLELWHRKKNAVISEGIDSERTRWGLRLQDAIAKGIAADQGWVISPLAEYMRVPEMRVGCSFDYSIGDEGILEIKNVDGLVYKNEWFEDDGLEAPPHIELQLQMQFLVSGRKFGYVGALVGGNRIILIRREPVPDVINSIKAKVAAFWESIAQDVQPRPQFPEDIKFISRLYGSSTPGKAIQSDPEIENLVVEYKAATDRAKKAEEQRDIVKSRLLMQIGDAEKVFGSNFSISAGVTNGGHIEYERKAFRNFRVNFKREKPLKIEPNSGGNYG
jgi:predicted phage-related endonuclease